MTGRGCTIARVLLKILLVGVSLSACGHSDGGIAVKNPSAISIGSDGTIYTLDKWDGIVTVVKDKKVVSTLKLAGGEDLAAGPDGSVYVVDNNGPVQLIRDNQVVGTITVGQGPVRVAAAPDGNVFVTNSGDDTVSVIRDAEVVATVPIPGLEEGDSVDRVVVGPSGTVYVSSIGRVWVISDNAVVDSVAIDAGINEMSVGPDGTLYVTNDDGLTSIRDNAIDEELALSQPDAVVAAPDGSVYVVGNDKVFVVRHNAVVNTVEVAHPRYIAVSPDGAVYATNSDGFIVQINSASR